MRAYAFFYLYGNDPLPRQRYRDALPRLFCARLSRAEPLCVRAPWAHPTGRVSKCPLWANSGHAEQTVRKIFGTKKRILAFLSRLGADGVHLSIHTCVPRV